MTPLLPRILNLPISVAPEREALLRAEMQEWQLALTLDFDSEKWVFGIPECGDQIIVGVKGLERLWAASYAFFVIYEVLREHPPGSEICLHEPPHVLEAMELLTWAIDAELDRIPDPAGGNFSVKRPEDCPRIPWPSGLPHPIPAPPQDSREFFADQIFLYAVGSIFHHELAHFRGKHALSRSIPSKLSISQEKEADQMAVDTLLDGLNERDPAFLVRILGVALGFAWVTSLLFWSPPERTPVQEEGTRKQKHKDEVPEKKKPRHPPVEDRLYNVVSRHVTGEGHPVWVFVDAILRLAVCNKAPEAMPASADSPRDFVEQILNYVSAMRVAQDESATPMAGLASSPRIDYSENS